MKHEVKVSFYVKKNEEKEDGRCPVMARLTVGSTEAVFSAKLAVPAGMWSSGRAKGKSQIAVEINRRLDGIRASALSHHRELLAVKENVTAEDVKSLILGMASGQETLLAYFRACNEKFDKRVGVNRRAGSAKAYWVAFRHLSRFLSEKYRLSDIPFSALDRSFIDKYDLYLRVERRLSQGTIVLLTTRLGTIINHAIADGIITADPFAGYERVYPAPKQKYLTREELDRLIATPLASPTQYLIREMFLFASFTGLAYADLKQLSEEHIVTAPDGSQWIHIKRKKTGTDTRVRLMEIPLQIIEKYRHERKGKLIFNTYNRCYMYRLIKEVGKQCGIECCRFHQSRHCFGTHICLSMGVPIETVSRMMGHKSISTTQIYAKVTDKKVDEDMKKLRARTGGQAISLHEDEQLRAAIRFPGAKRTINTGRTTNNNV